MTDNLEIFGNIYLGVTGIKATDTNGVVQTYIKPEGSKSITQNGTNIDVAQYATVDVSVGGSTPTYQTITKTYTPTTSQQSETITRGSGYDAIEQVNVTVNAMPTGSATAPASISGTAATVSTGTNTLTLSKTVSVTPTVSAGYISAGTAGNSSVSLQANVTTKARATITPGTSNQTISSGTYLTGTQTISGDANLVAGNIKQGVSIFGVAGNYAGSGTGKNAQIANGLARVRATAYTAVTGQTLKVAKTGTYDVYWIGYRSSTSGTNGSQLYIGSTAYGSAQTTFNSTYTNWQLVHLSNVSLTADQNITVYARSRGTSYYMYISNLTIIEA